MRNLSNQNFVASASGMLGFELVFSIYRIPWSVQRAVCNCFAAFVLTRSWTTLAYQRRIDIIVIVRIFRVLIKSKMVYVCCPWEFKSCSWKTNIEKSHGNVNFLQAELLWQSDPCNFHLSILIRCGAQGGASLLTKYVQPVGANYLEK